MFCTHIHEICVLLQFFEYVWSQLPTHEFIGYCSISFQVMLFPGFIEPFDPWNDILLNITKKSGCTYVNVLMLREKTKFANLRES